MRAFRKLAFAGLILALAAPSAAQAGCFGKFFDKLGGKGGFRTPADEAGAFIGAAGNQEVVITLSDGSKVRGKVARLPNSDEVMVYSGGGNGQAMMGRRIKLGDIQPGGFSFTEAALPNGERVALQGDPQFVSWATPGNANRTPGRVRRIYADANGTVHVEVEEITASGVNAPRELTADELKSTRFSNTAKSEYAARVAPPAPPARPVEVSEHVAPSGQRISTSGDAQYVSFVSGTDRVPGRVRRMWTDASGQLHVEAEVWNPVMRQYEVRELTQGELASVRPSATAKQQFAGNPGASAHAKPAGEPLEPPPTQRPATPPDAAQRERAIRQEFPAGSPAHTSTGTSYKNLPTPSGRSERFWNNLGDRAYGQRMGRIFDDVSPASLPRGKRYTYVITADGHVSFGMVEDSWEFGVKHMHIANGRPVVVAGELEVTAAGQLRFNLESGTFTKQLVRGGVNPDSLATKVQDIFAREVGSSNVTQVAGDGILTQAFSGRIPESTELQRLCVAPEFTMNKPAFCAP